MHGVEGEDGRLARQLYRFLRRREIASEVTGAPDVHRGRVGGENLSELILTGGAARALEAGPELFGARRTSPINARGNLAPRALVVQCVAPLRGYREVAARNPFPPLVLS